MKESNLWNALKKRLERGGVLASRIENRVMPGMADVHWIYEGRCGWIELKVVPQPVRDSTSYDLRRYTEEQRLFAKDQWMAGACVHLLLQAGRTWMLIPAPYCLHVDDVANVDLREAYTRPRDLMVLHLLWDWEQRMRGVDRRAVQPKQAK